MNTTDLKEFTKLAQAAYGNKNVRCCGQLCNLRALSLRH